MMPPFWNANAELIFVSRGNSRNNEEFGMRSACLGGSNNSNWRRQMVQRYLDKGIGLASELSLLAPQ